MLAEFKKFALKGNVMDMAVGIIIGGAFGKIVSSFVADVVMPPIGLIVGNVNFTDLKFELRAASEGISAVTVNYGKFIQTSFDFVIMAFAIFMMVRTMNRLKAKEEAKPPASPPKEQVLLEEIRDLLKK